MKLAPLLAVTLLWSASIPAQTTPTSDEAAQRSVLSQFSELSSQNRLQSPEAKRLLSGEAAEWKGPAFGTISFDTIIQTGPGQAVARIPAQGGNPEDFYIYLRLIEGEWKITSARTVAAGFDEHPTISDKDLRDWFQSNRARFEQLKNDFAGVKGDYWCTSGDGNSNAALTKLKALRLTCVTNWSGGDEAGEEGLTHFIIGGMADNEVGFLFVAKGFAPPPITDDHYIWVEQLDDGWYLYRAT